MKLPRGRLGYLTATFGVMAVGAPIVWTAAPDRREAWLAGALAAWLIQVPAYWVLVGRLERGLDATRQWLVGIAARFGGLTLLAAASWTSDLPGGVAAAYGVAMLVFLVLEAAWLAGAARPDTRRP